MKCWQNRKCVLDINFVIGEGSAIPCCLISGRANLMVWNAAERWMASISFHFSTGHSSTGSTCWMPALLTSTSGPRENCSLILWYKFWILSGSQRSAAWWWNLLDLLPANDNTYSIAVHCKFRSGTRSCVLAGLDCCLNHLSRPKSMQHDVISLTCQHLIAVV